MPKQKQIFHNIEYYSQYISFLVGYFDLLFKLCEVVLTRETKLSAIPSKSINYINSV